MRRILTVLGSTLLALACSSQKPAAKLDDSGLARLNESQMEPVDEARIEEGRAHDEAQLKRAQAERDLLKKQYADKDRMAEVEQEVAGAQGRIQATDLKLRYLQQTIAVAESERRLAEAHVGTAQARTERAKLRAMKAGNVPQAGSANEGDIDRRVAEYEGQEASFRKEAAQRRSDAVDLYNRWQQADASARTLARPSTLAVPPPTSEPTTH